MADGVAVEGMRLIKNWLPAACADGNDLEARGNMQVASSMGATAFQKGLGAMHSLSHPCGSLLDTHHGLTNGVVMPYVLAFNGEVIEEKMTALARYLDLPNPSGKSVRDWVLHLREEIGIAHTLAGIGVSEELIPRLAKMAVDDPTAPTNPVKLTVANLETLYANAINGALAS
jgi:alcohol dehydrogenase class IV